MGWQDRDYASQRGYNAAGGRMRFRGSGMAAYDVVTKIIIANIIVHVLAWNTSLPVLDYGVMQPQAVWHGQIWRLFTATYLHANFMHIFINMLMLYFLGPMMERRWGSRQFFIAYTIGGIAGNVLLTLLAVISFIQPETFGLGALGSVWTIMAGAAVCFPHTEVLVYFLFPVKMRTLVIVYGLWFVYNILQKGANYGGDLSHLAGLLFGVWWARTGGFRWATGVPYPGRRPISAVLASWFGKGSKRAVQPTFRERVSQRKEDSATVDRILAKVYEKGIHALSPEERRQLTEATERLKQQETQGRV